MMRKRKNASVCLAVIVILTCYLSQTIDCYRLRKTERREGRTDDDEPESTAIREGRIVFGRVYEKGSGFEPQASNGTQKSSAVSSEDKTAYQADFTGWYKGQSQDASSGGSSWSRMNPSLQCAGDQMKFRVMGPGASQFVVERGNAPPMPLSQVPPSCGYTMQRNPLSLVMSVPYDGCNMLQEGGNHVLPMRWQGIPVSLQCPGSGAAPNNPPSHHQMPPSQHASNPHVSNPQAPQYPSYPHHPPQYPSMPEPAKKPSMPQIPQYPPYFPQYPSFPYPFPMTTAKPTTSKPTTTAKPAKSTHPPKIPYPYFPPYYPPFPWPYPGPKPTTAAPTTTAKQTTTQTTTKPTTKPQPPRYPPYFPYPPYYPYPPFFPPFFPPYQPQPTMKPKTTTKPTTTTPTTTTTTATTMTTTKKTDPPRGPPYPPYPFPFPLPYPMPPMPYPYRPPV